jgi:predicted Rdx family selenoprotein
MHMLKAVTLKEIERIFAVIDPMNISREAVEIPLRTEHPGRVSILKNGKLEIVVERDGDFEDWIKGLEAQIRDLMKPAED